jgi:hypothetical protein
MARKKMERAVGLRSPACLVLFLIRPFVEGPVRVCRRWLYRSTVYEAVCGLARDPLLPNHQLQVPPLYACPTFRGCVALHHNFISRHLSGKETLTIKNCLWGVSCHLGHQYTWAATQVVQVPCPSARRAIMGGVLLILPDLGVVISCH